MSGIVSRRPLVGFAAGGLFGALGWLLLQIEGGVLFALAGLTFLFVAVVSFLAALFRIGRPGPPTG